MSAQKLGDWATHELAEYLSALSGCPDVGTALQVAIERAAEGLEAGIGFIVLDGAVAASVGFARGDAPGPELIRQSRSGSGRVEIKGLGMCWITTAPLSNGSGSMVLARSHAREFDPEERNLLRAMAKVVVLVTGMLRTTADLEESRRHTQEILDSASGAFVLMNGDGVVIDWNRSAEVIFGWSRTQALGRALSELIVPAEGTDEYLELIRLKSAGAGADASQRLEFTAVDSGGRRFPVEMTVWQVGDGPDVTFSAFVHDITQEREMELRQAQLAGIVRASDSMIVSCDPHGVMTTWNPAAERLLGYRFEEVVGRSFGIFIPPETMTEIWNHFQRLLEGEPLRQYETKLLRKDGSRVEVTVTGFPLKDASDRIVGVSAIVDDITERKIAEEELARMRDRALEASRLKSRFLANMSHEIRTPMNGVLGMAELLLDTKLDESQRKFAETIQTSAESLLGIISDILDLSKIEAGRLELERSLFDLRDPAAHVAKMLAVPASNKGLQILVDIDDGLPDAVIGDPGRLRQVLTNLVGNAVKFTDAGEVRIRLAPASPAGAAQAEVYFEVSDTGVGIDPERLVGIFDPFSQADPSTTRRYGGTGLGLTITRQLVELMGGSCGVDSQPGVGSTFWFTVSFDVPAGDLRSRAGRTQDRTGSGEPEAAVAGRTGRVLVVEDNSVNQLVAISMLEGAGYVVGLAGDGAEAVKAVRDGDYDLVLMDCQMPVMDGYEATKAIRSGGEAYSRTPIVAMTAGAMTEDRERALESGMDDYISKPIGRDELLKVVNRRLRAEPRQTAS